MALLPTLCRSIYLFKASASHYCWRSLILAAVPSLCEISSLMAKDTG